MRSLGGANDQKGFKTKVSRRKSRGIKKKKPEQDAAEESGEEKNDEDEDQSTQFEMIKESNAEYMALKKRAEAGEAISKKQLFL
jgi:hypothetical protein